VRISAERGAYLPARPSVARGYSSPVRECPDVFCLRSNYAVEEALMIAASRISSVRCVAVYEAVAAMSECS
jgi:hypothetical protein